MPTARAFPEGQTAPVINGKIYLIGGQSVQEGVPTASDKVEIYDPASNTWQSAPALPHGLFRHAALATADSVYVIGGQSASGDILGEVWKMGDAWTPHLAHEHTYDLDADGAFSKIDVGLFARACRRGSAYWECDLTADGRFDAKDIGLHRAAGRNDNDGTLARAFLNHQGNLQVTGIGKVIRVLPDDLSGDRHQRFILRLASRQTVLVAHNIDLAPRLNGLRPGDSVGFYGEYEWSPEGGVIHWTHHDPDGPHADGWLKWRGRFYR